MTDHNHRSAGTEDAADFDTYWRDMYYDLLNRSRADWMADGAAAQPAPEAIQEVAANAIRTFCQNLGANTIVVTGGVERIYYSGLSLDALAVAVALALSSPHHEASK